MVKLDPGFFSDHALLEKFRDTADRGVPNFLTWPIRYRALYRAHENYVVSHLVGRCFPSEPEIDELAGLTRRSEHTLTFWPMS
jgi:hypothetical protein